jgi:hypothetical protein
MVSATDSSDGVRPTSFADFIGQGNGVVATTATVRWPNSGALDWQDAQMTTPDVSAVIQELVDRYGGLSAGSSVVIWLYGTADLAGNKEVILADFGHAEHNTTLNIDFEYYE